MPITMRVWVVVERRHKLSGFVRNAAHWKRVCVRSNVKLKLGARLHARRQHSTCLCPCCTLLWWPRHGWCPPVAQALRTRRVYRPTAGGACTARWRATPGHVFRGRQILHRLMLDQGGDPSVGQHVSSTQALGGVGPQQPLQKVSRLWSKPLGDDDSDATTHTVKLHFQ